jgi:hypothetical protein
MADASAVAESTPPSTIALQEENARLREQLAGMQTTVQALTAKKAESDEFEKIVLHKMKVGLTRQQAEAVVRRQHDYDRSQIGRRQRARYEARISGTLN